MNIESTGDHAVRYALQSARNMAGLYRLRGWTCDDRFDLGYVLGQLLVAQFDMRADPLLVAAAKNECRFLLGSYLDGSK